MSYTRIQLENSFNIHKLKEICIELGGTPGTKNKAEIIDLIIDIQNGVAPKKKTAGRKSNFEKFNDEIFHIY